MIANQNPTEWRVIGETVPGASHLRAGIPNQDAILQLRESARSLPLILSVSDGHGSHKCFRSDRGSRFAVRKAVQIVGEFLEARRGAFDTGELETAAREHLPREFVRSWKETVEADLKGKPFSREELGALEEKTNPQARALVEANPLLAYGATSLTVVVEESFILYLQLGDGAILNVSEGGEVSSPLPEDARLLANETTSLCTDDADKNFRFHLQPIAGAHPALIILSTDGYVNSFADEEGFLKVGRDILEMLRTDGFDFVNESLKGWLEEATRLGSGDDTTLGIICRMNALKRNATASAAATDAPQTPVAQVEAEPPPVPHNDEVRAPDGDPKAPPPPAISVHQQDASHDEQGAHE